MRTLMWLLLSWPSTAGAVPLVVGPDADPEPRARLARVDPTVQAELVYWQELASTTPPTLVGPGTLQPCPGAPTTRLRIDGAVETARAALPVLDTARALAVLDEASAALGCLGEPIEPGLLVELAFLGGVAHGLAGRPEEARAAFRLALALDPGLRWDLRWPPAAGEALLDEERGDAARLGRARVAAVPGEGPLWLDGRPWTGEALDLVAGRHVLQWGEAPHRAAWLEAEAGATTTLVIPSLAADRLPDPLAGGEAAALLLSTVLGPDREAWLARGPDLLHGTTGAADWQRREAPPPPRRGPHPLTWAGAGLGLAGGGLLAWGGIAQAGAVASCEEARGVSPADCADARTRYDAAAPLYTIGGAVAAAGLLGTTVGLLLDGPTGWTLAPGPGLGLSVHGRLP